MRDQYLNLHHTPTLRGQCTAAIITLLLLTALVPDSFAQPKRVAVLYFEDHSRFDSPTGCGCLPTSIFGKIFGSGKGRTKWQLKPGFTDLLNRSLEQTQVYEPISQDEIMDAMALSGLSKRALQSDAKNRGLLAKALKAEALIVGDIRKFNQERLRANAARLVREGRSGDDRGSFGVVGGIEVIGHLYIASIQLDMVFYGQSGDEIDNPKISASKRHQLGGAKVAALEAVVTEEGTEFKMGQMPPTEKKIRPIVRREQLNKIEFGTPEYDRTLLGLATNEALKKVVAVLRENIGPEGIVADATTSADEGQSVVLAPQSGAIEGTIIYVDAEDPEKTYINIGAAKGIAVNEQLKVYTEEPLIDPETHDILGSVSKPVGLIEVVKVETDQLSRARVVEGFGDIRKGDKVRREKSDPSGDESE